MCLARAAKPSALKLKVIYKHEMREGFLDSTYQLVQPLKSQFAPC